MTLAIACPTCWAQPGDSCWGADGRYTPQHVARLEEGERPAVFGESLTNHPDDAARVERLRGQATMPEPFEIRSTGPGWGVTWEQLMQPIDYGDRR